MPPKKTVPTKAPTSVKLRLTGKHTIATETKTTEPVKKAIAFDPGLACLSCEQEYGSVDKDSLTMELLKWPKTNTLADGSVKACGKECGPCFNDRCKRQKGLTQAQVVEQNQDPTKKAVNARERTNYVQGVTKWRKVEQGDQASKVTQKHSEFSRNYGEGFFYKVVDYLALLEKDLDVKGWTQKKAVNYMRRHHPEVTIYVDKSGD